MFCTEFSAAGRSYSGNIIAGPTAEQIAFGRGLVEIVMGEMVRGSMGDFNPGSAQ